jgi:hypothetical protein
MNISWLQLRFDLSEFRLRPQEPTRFNKDYLIAIIIIIAVRIVYNYTCGENEKRSAAQSISIHVEKWQRTRSTAKKLRTKPVSYIRTILSYREFVASFFPQPFWQVGLEVFNELAPR